jgi:hypothetical protein
MNSTTLFFPLSLTDLHGNTGSGGKSDWAFGHGFINFRGSDSITYTGSSPTFRAWVTANATKGSNVLTVSNVTGLTPGLRVRVTASDPPTGETRALVLTKGLLDGKESSSPVPAVPGTCCYFDVMLEEG